jgi:hypothetical protein
MEYTLVENAEALQTLLSAEQYLYATTYASDGKGSRTFSQWYHDVADSVELLRSRQDVARHTIAKRIGAVIS